MQIYGACKHPAHDARGYMAHTSILLMVHADILSTQASSYGTCQKKERKRRKKLPSPESVLRGKENPWIMIWRDMPTKKSEMFNLFLKNASKSKSVREGKSVQNIFVHFLLDHERLYQNPPSPEEHSFEGRRVQESLLRTKPI